VNDQALSESIGQLALLHRDLEAILNELRKGSEWGGVADLRRVYWDPAAPDANHDLTAEYAHDGTFNGIGIYNLSSGVIRAAFTPNASRTDTSSLFTLSARAFIVQPYRGTTVSVSGAAAGSALLVAYSTPPQPAAGIF